MIFRSDAMVVIIKTKKPSPILSPNARVNWAQRAREAKKTREAGFWHTYQARRGGFLPPVSRVLWSSRGRPPDVAHFVARFMSFLVGCCVAFGVAYSLLALAGVPRLRVNHKDMANMMEVMFSDGKGGEA